MILSDSKFDFLYKYNKPINWNLSGFGNEEQMYLINRLYEFLQKFNVKFPISTIHGSYASRYNGGRLAMFTNTLQKTYDKIREWNNKDVGVKMTFSTPYMTKEMYEEEEMRGYLEVLSERKDLKNGIICSVDEFANFIHKNYPSLEVTSSYVKMAYETKLGETDTSDYFNKLFDIYDILVLNTYRAFDEEYLSKIKYLDRIEFIVNNSCNLNCPIAKQHYELMYKWSKLLLDLNFNTYRVNHDKHAFDIKCKMDKLNENCMYRKRINDFEKLKYQFINREEINKLLDLGVKNFKLEGRDLYIEELSETLFTFIVNYESLFWTYRNMPQKKDMLDWINRKKIPN